MSTVTCPTCGVCQSWSWTEAFDKFGFNDGDGIVLTHKVVDVLRDAGCVVHAEPLGCHNVVITGLRRDGVSCIPESARLGYDDPRDYLPDDIIALLDAAFSDDTEVQP
jgi:hypothetical protein